MASWAWSGQCNNPEMQVMKKIGLFTVLSVLALPLFAAEPDTKTMVKDAAKKLAEQANYAWKTTSKQESGERNFQSTMEGKTEKGGFTQVSLTFGDRTVEVALKGGKVAVKQEEEWKSGDELESNIVARRFKTFKVPGDDAADLAEKAKELKPGADGLYAGDLSEQGVKEFFARYRREGSPEAKEVKGSIKFWLKDGALTKYEYNIQGKITMGQNQDETVVNGTSTVEIKDIGTTKLSIPDAAKKKHSS
jgi:hypothetical protein